MLLKIGARGLNVQDLQTALNNNGANLLVDGDFGQTTYNAVKTYQTANNLVADGVVGTRTWSLLHGNAADPRDLTEADLAAAAERLGCETAAIKAIVRVEAPTGGFEDNGNVVILFERHKMYHFLSELKNPKINPDVFASSFPNLVNKTPGGYSGGTAEYQRLTHAMTIEPRCALLSASYGRFQMMGFNYKVCGFDTVESFVDAMKTSEGEQLKAFCAFIEANPTLKKALKAKNWVVVAENYNGKNYKINAYDLKLARAYAMYSA